MPRLPATDDTGAPRTSVNAGAGALRQIVTWAGDAYPNEACGCLIGTRDERSVEIQRATRGANLVTQHPAARYELDPGHIVAADRLARAAGLELIGIWHSHPDHAATPSTADRLDAFTGWSYLIVSVGTHGAPPFRPAVRSWRLRDGRFREELLRR